MPKNFPGTAYVTEMGPSTIKCVMNFILAFTIIVGPMVVAHFFVTSLVKVRPKGRVCRYMEWSTLFVTLLSRTPGAHTMIWCPNTYQGSICKN